MRRLALFAGMAAVAMLLARAIGPRDPLPFLPRLILWAWESPQDLRFVKPGSAGIAFLARTVWLDEKRVRSRPRLQPLSYTPGTDLIAGVSLASSGPGLPPIAHAARAAVPASDIVCVRPLHIDVA